MARNIHREITDRIVSQLKAGVVPWRKPWSGKASEGGVMPRNGLTSRAYSGINILLLWNAREAMGYGSPKWFTYQQAQEVGGQVRKGEKSTQIVFVSHLDRKDEKTGEDRKIPFLKTYNVFNADQIDGLKLDAPKPIKVRNADGRDDDAEDFLAATGATIKHGEGRAYFRPGADFIMLPDFETFESANTYYATAFHELAHWTGADKRLARTFGKRFGDSAYSAEELVAELSSAFLCAEFGFETEGQDAAYIATWIKFLTDHEGAIVAAASAASKACDYLRELAIAEPDAIAA